MRTRVVMVAGVLAVLLAALGAIPGGAQDAAPTGSTPGTDCRPDDTPEPAQQGRVPSSVYEGGWDTPFTCNADLLASHNSTGGFKVERYVDADGHECAYYDSTLVFPLDLPTQLSEGAGVVALDMADPTDPVRTTTLTSPAMLSPHESLVLHQGRGLLLAVLGSAAAYPGQVDVYDVSEDCRDPQLLSSLPIGVLGHESGISPDGQTFWTSSLFTDTIAAVDVSDPRVPRTLWTGHHSSHGIGVSDDGSRLYLTPFRGLDGSGSADGLDGDFDGGLTILDVTSIRDRDPLPQPEVVSTLQWPDVSIPQIAIPVTWDGRDHLVEVDEFTDGFDPENLFTGEVGDPGAARIIDIADETAPHVVSTIRLAVHDPEVRRTDGILDDPGARAVYKGYAAHYCQVDRREDPRLLACSMIQSGLRVFDVRDPAAPREIAYVNVPGRPGTPPINPEGTAYAMSQPVIVPERGEVWFSDTASGFHVVRLAEEVFPFAVDVEAPASTPASTDDATEQAPGAPAQPVAAPAPSGPPLPTTGGTLIVAGLAAMATGALLRRR